MRNSVIKTIMNYSKRNNKVFFITGDAGYGVLDKYKENFPDRFLNLGVAEQNMISFASGLSLAGYKVFVYNIIPFLLYRCYEQVRNDICYQDLPVTLIGVGSGITYAPQGATHYAVEDIALARTLPNLIILSPSDPVEAEKCAEFSLRSKNPVYIRIAKSGEPIIHKQGIKSISEPIIVNEGSEVGILFHGSIGSEVISALKCLKRTPKVISLPMLQPLNFDFLLSNLEGIHTLITIEEHFIEGGLGSIIEGWVVKNMLNFRVKKLGIKNEFIHAINNPAGMRNLYGISCNKIIRTVEKAFLNFTFKK